MRINLGKINLARGIAGQQGQEPLDQRGFSIVETLVGAAILSIIALGIGSLAGFGQTNSARLRAARVASSGRVNLEAALKEPNAWQQTLTHNPDLYCGTVSPGCDDPGGYHDFVIYGSGAGQKVSYDPADPTSRLSITGGPCEAGEANPSAKCPIKFVAQWKPLCATYPCMNPALDIKVNLVTEFDGGTPPINPVNYGYSAVRPAGEDPLQSACFVMNGTYNVSGAICVPKFAGKSCAALGKPYQVITAVHANGSIECAPLYHGTCNLTTQVLGGTAADGAAQCQAKAIGACPTNCQGGWGACSSATCVAGTQTYAITTPAANGGLACPFAAGQIQACGGGPCVVDCVGAWGGCSLPCGGGTMTYNVSTPSANGGLACPANNGDSMGCNSQACGVPVNCGGAWSACNLSTGQQDFVVTQMPQNGGAACPASPQNCAVNCQGGWSVCTAGVKTYTWTTTPKNGGAACPYGNAQTDSVGCPPQTCHWGLSDNNSGNKYSNIAKLLGSTLVDEVGACASDVPECGGDLCTTSIGSNCGTSGQMSTCYQLGPGPCCGMGIPCPCTVRSMKCNCL